MSVDFNKFKVKKDSEQPIAPRKTKRYFVRSMDYAWTKRAAAIRGRALHIAVGVWFHAGLYRKKFGQPFFVSVSRIARDFKIKPATARRGFRDLEADGLLTVKRRVGKKSEVTLICPDALLSSPAQGSKPGQPIFDSPESETSSPPGNVEDAS